MESMKKTILLGACFLVLVASVLGGFMFVVQDCEGIHATHEDSVDNSLKAVQEFCRNVRYKDTCVKSISSSTNATNTPTLMRVGFEVAIKEIRNALKKSLLLHTAATDSATAIAYKTCEMTLDDSIDDLRRTVARLDSLDLKDLKKLDDDLKTWLTGSATYQQTCLDAFGNTQGQGGEAAEEMKKLLRVGGELTTGALGMVHEISKFLESTSFPGLYRKLLWESDEGIITTSRRLLHVMNASPNVTVAQDGSGECHSINEALKKVVPEKSAPFIIYVKEGVYAEYITITKRMRNIMLIGDGPTKTKITGNKSFVGGFGTFLSATVVVEGDHFTAKDIGFENSAGPEMHQAVALRVTGDESIFHNCRIDGYQNTLYAHNHRQFYHDCTISGTTDFIFGNARAILQNCTLLIREPLEKEQKLGMVTAQGRFEEEQVSAIILQNCRIIPDPDLSFPVEDQAFKAYLGRPWKAFSRTIVLDSDIDAVIHPDGWARWQNDQNLNTCWFAEIGNRGPGADQARRVKWPCIRQITDEDAENFTPGRFFLGAGWIRAAGLHFVAGRISS